MIILTIPLYDFCRITTTLPFVGMIPPNAGILILPFVGMNPPGVQTPLGILVLPFVGMNQPSVQTPLGILFVPFVGMNQPSVQMPLGIMLPSNVKVIMGITIPPNAGITTQYI